jgi:hypothetical protein
MTTTQTLPPIQFKLDKKSDDDDEKIVIDVEETSDFNIWWFLLLAGGPYTIYIFWIGLLILIWITSGFIAFFASFICLFYNSSAGDKIAGLVMALFAGPFYWLFYIYNSNYCNSYPVANYGY